MTVHLGKIDRAEAKRLISLASRATLEEFEIQAIDQCIKLSATLWAGAVDGEFVCAWGMIPPTLLSEQAYLWLYTTERVREYEFLFVRHSQRAVEQMLEEYPVLVGQAHVDNERGIRWLRWLGASFGEPEGKAVPFRIRKKKWTQ